MQVLLTERAPLFLHSGFLTRRKGDLLSTIETTHAIRETQATDSEKVRRAWWLEYVVVYGVQGLVFVGSGSHEDCSFLDATLLLLYHCSCSFANCSNSSLRS